MRLDEALAALSRAEDLPGAAAHARMEPPYRREPGFMSSGIDKPWREAAVLILLYGDERGEARFPLMLRPRGTGVHAGQLSLPGGALERGEGQAEAALRECREELGVCEDGISVLRCLSLLQVAPSRFLVTPVVGLARGCPVFVPNAAEAELVIEPAVSELLDGDHERIGPAPFRGRDWPVPYYELGGYRVWGATAMILAEFAELLRGGLSDGSRAREPRRGESAPG